jgi:hypothetical protein
MSPASNYSDLILKVIKPYIRTEALIEHEWAGEQRTKEIWNI